MALRPLLRHLSLPISLRALAAIIAYSPPDYTRQGFPEDMEASWRLPLPYRLNTNSIS